jgi:hypothetical protein
MVSVGLDVCGRAMVSLVSDGLDLGGRAMVPTMSDGLDLGGWGYGVCGVCWFGPGWSGLWCLMIWAGVLRCLWCLWRLDRGGRAMTPETP